MHMQSPVSYRRPWAFITKHNNYYCSCMHTVIMFEHRFVYTFFGFCFLLHTCYDQGKENVYEKCACVCTRENRHAMQLCVREREREEMENIVREERAKWEEGMFNWWNSYLVTDIWIHWVSIHCNYGMTVTKAEGLVCCACTMLIVIVCAQTLILSLSCDNTVA